MTVKHVAIELLIVAIGAITTENRAEKGAKKKLTEYLRAIKCICNYVIKIFITSNNL